nr:MAG TPA: Protein of unknown function (DUF2829) [Caudoviricetes sp.]
MNFKQAYQEMLNGKKIRRPGWGGYWFIEDGKVKIQLKTGEIIENDFNQETITNTLADDWVITKKEVCWKPQRGVKYFSIDGDGELDWNLYDAEDTYYDNSRMSIGNYFQTEQQAEFMIEKLKVIHELKIFAVENNEEEIDWNNDDQKKFFLYYNCMANEVSVDWVPYIKDIPFNVYFTGKSIAEKSIDAIGIERLKKYYFEVEEE